MEPKFIAPCGINCFVCSGFQRKKDPCSGCNGTGYKPTYCQTCIIKHCSNLTENNLVFCNKCLRFPCKRLKQLEKRYRTKYGVNIYENMKRIEQDGLTQYIKDEEIKWQCKECGDLLCMHKKTCKTCNENNPYYIGTQA